jgi:REP element-mobilizing transposase RayT
MGGFGTRPYEFKMAGSISFRRGRFQTCPWFFPIPALYLQLTFQQHENPETNNNFSGLIMSSGIYNELTGYHNRRSIRLRGWDYSQSGYYFITVCCHDRNKHLFGDLVRTEPDRSHMVINQFGEIIHATWNDLPNHVPGIILDEFIIMPNHIHGIIRIPSRISTPLPEIVRQFKTFSAKKINTAQKTPGITVWQRDYYEHIVRTEKELFAIRTYIKENPKHWIEDAENHIAHP